MSIVKRNISVYQKLCKGEIVVRNIKLLRSAVLPLQSVQLHHYI